MKSGSFSFKQMRNIGWSLGMLLLTLAGAQAVLSNDADPEWDRFQFDYNDAKYTVLIPKDLKENEGIRGAFKSNGRGVYGRLLHRNRMACVSSYGKKGPAGPDLAFLKAAADASGRKEIAHAGAYVEGHSARGRAAARWGAANAERCIAVTAHHSFIGSSPGMQMPRVPGAAMFMNSSKKDLYQGHNRRRLHYAWTRPSYPGMQSIYYKPTGHGLNGYSWDLVLVWLEEVIALRVPPATLIPRDGSPYELIPIDPSQVGGGVACDLVKAEPAEGGDIHTHVQVGPLDTFSKSGKGRQKFWVPGPKSAKLYLEWVKLNHGQVTRDESAKIASAPSFSPSDVKGFNAKLIAYMKHKMYGTALSTIDAAEKSDRNKLTEREVIIKDIIKKYMLAQESELVEELKQSKEAGDYYLLDKLINDNKKQFGKMPKYEAFVLSVKDLMQDSKTRALIRNGKELEKLMTAIQLTEGRARAAFLRRLDSFAKRYADNRYGREAERLYESLTQK